MMNYRGIILNLHEETNGNSKGLSEAIDKYLIPHELEKKTNAEISTPYKLRQEMLDKVPIEFWSTPKKVFEPCSGKGGFVIDIVHRFMEGMKEIIVDEKERYRVTVEECLYFSDINPTNIFICKLLLDPYDEYNLNYNEGDTLELDVRDKWDIEGFDAVIGNPPYNPPTSVGSGSTIWQHFIKLGINILRREGYLMLVHPSSWRKPTDKKSKMDGLFDFMTKENTIIYLEIHNTKDGMKTFKCGTRYDWYLIQKKIPETDFNTEIKGEDGVIEKINLNGWKFLPNNNFSFIERLLCKNEEDESCNIIMNSSYHTTRDYVSKNKTEEFRYPLVHSTTKSGVRYLYSKVNDKGHFGISKVIFGDSGIHDPIIDIEGEYGMTEHSFGIMVNDFEEGILVRNAINTDKFKDLLKISCSWSNYQIDRKLLTFFRSDFYEEFISEDIEEVKYD